MARSPTTIHNPPPRKHRIATNSWLISLVIHTVCLLLLAMIVLPRLTTGDGRVVRLRMGEMDSQNLEKFDLSSTLEISSESTDETETMETLIRESEMVFTKPPIIERPQTLEAISRILTKPIRSQPRLNSSRSATSAIRQASGVAAALDGVTDAIRRELAGGDVLVAWLFDSSTSLNEHRMQMAEKARDFFAELESESRANTGRYGTLSNTIVAFGKRSRVVQSPSDDMRRAIHAMRGLPVDRTGVENVMASVQDVLRRFRKRSVGPQRMLVVILTDESGDDVGALEKTIDQCRDYEVPVHVLGATSAFGLHRTSQVISGQYIATVMKGPESAQQERFHAGFWYEDDFPRRGPQINDFPWYGGRLRECVPAGFGTYALTRLTQQTGGTYTVFDRQGIAPESGNYDLERMRPYLPGYESQIEYMQSAKRSTLRSFVLAAASLSHESRFAPPPPHRWSASQSRTPLEDIVRRQKMVLANTQRSIMALLSQYQNVDWAAQLQSEPDLRWKAWLDLNRGRMLAYSVRIAEYLAANESLKPSALARAKQARWQPSEQFLQPTSPLLARQAREHLERCIRDHGETPWAALAKWELEHPFGTRVTIAP